jgi:hypothetical protein
MVRTSRPNLTCLVDVMHPPFRLGELVKWIDGVVGVRVIYSAIRTLYLH